MLRMIEIETPEELAIHMRERGHLRRAVIQGVDLGEASVDWSSADVRGAFFIGCRAPDAASALALQRSGAVVIPDLGEGRPFRIYPPHLYTYDELVGGGIDAAVQDYVERSSGHTGDPDPDRPIEAIAQRLHDTAMSDAIWELVLPEDDAPRRMVGVMGGHATRRDAEIYRRIVEVAYGLTEAGFTIATGGGPGIMEAGNLGAFLTCSGDSRSIDPAIEQLSAAPTVHDPEYESRAEAVHRLHADRPGGISLAIPTWLYDHEPVGRFASHIAKYFANSIREDGLLRVAGAGILFAPGGAGTVQEVFQDLAVNTYSEPARRAPMVFFGREHFRSSGVHEVVVRMAAAADPPFDELVAITDDVGEAVERIVSG